MNIHEALGYGPICASNEEMDCFVGINGTYLNLWVSRGNGQYENTDCRSGHKDLYKLTGAEMIDLAEKALSDWINGDEEDEEEKEEENEEEGA